MPLFGDDILDRVLPTDVAVTGVKLWPLEVREELNSLTFLEHLHHGYKKEAFSNGIGGRGKGGSGR